VELSEAQLQRFIELYERRFGITLNKTDAHRKALQVLNYVRIAVIPVAKIETNDINTMPNVSDIP